MAAILYFIRTYLVSDDAAHFVSGDGWYFSYSWSLEYFWRYKPEQAPDPEHVPLLSLIGTNYNQASLSGTQTR